MPRKTNKLKEVQKKDNKKKRKVRSKSGSKKLFPEFFYDERFKKISGFFIILLSIYLLFAFTSYFISWFTWGTDDIFSGISFNRIFLDNDIEVHNWTGRLGAAIAHQFIKEWIGVASYLVFLLLFITGVKMMLNISILPLGKTFRISIIAILWLSDGIGMIFKNDDQYSILGGVFGYQSSIWLTGIIGTIGTAFLLIFVFFSLLLMLRIIPVGRKKSRLKTTPVEDLQDGSTASGKQNQLKEDKYNTIEFTVEEEETGVFRLIQIKTSLRQLQVEIEPPEVGDD